MRLLAFACLSLTAFLIAESQALAAAAGAAASTMRLTSTSMADAKSMVMEQVLNGFGCTGGNVSPDVKWTNAPAATKSFALTLYDPDAPTGSGWWHWVVVDIPATKSELAKGAGKSGTVAVAGGGRQTRTDFGAPGYGGPCPPMGDKPHRYVLTLYALDVDKLDVPDDASGALVGFNLHAHALSQASMTAQYGR